MGEHPVRPIVSCRYRPFRDGYRKHRDAKILIYEQRTRIFDFRSFEIESFVEQASTR